MNNLTELALKTAQLPSLPELVNDLQVLIDKDEDINVIADLLATDASLSARVIELSNSAFYGNKNIIRIFDAVHLIGLSKIVLMVRTAYTVDILKSVDGARIDMRKFWKKSYTSALIAQRLAQCINYPQADGLYTSGLLMYIGELIFALLPPHIQLARMGLYELTAEQLSIWGFPSFIVESIRHTSTPTRSPDQYALPAAVIHIAYCVLHDKHAQVDKEAVLLTQLSKKDIDDIYSRIKELEMGEKN